MIENIGWRNAYLGFAALILFINLPLTLLFLRNTPQADDQALELAGNNDEILVTMSDNNNAGLSFKQATFTRSFVNVRQCTPNI